jgi:hypothetical protein
VKFTPTRRFRDGANTYEPGTEYEAADIEAAYFVRSGWAVSPDYTPPGVAPAPAVDVRPDSVTHRATTKER